MAGATVALAGSFWLQSQTGFVQKSILQAADWIPPLRSNPRILSLASPSKAPLDPSLDSFGWSEVAQELEKRGLLNRAGTFLFTGNWRDSGQLGYATRHSKTPVLCYSTNDPRGFAFWSRSADFVNQDGVLVLMDEKINEPSGFQGWFTGIDPVCERVVPRFGSPARRFRVFLCRNQRLAFPFDQAYGGDSESRIASARRGSPAQR